MFYELRWRWRSFASPRQFFCVVRLFKRTVLGGAFFEGTSFLCFLLTDTVKFVDLAMHAIQIVIYVEQVSSTIILIDSKGMGNL